MEPNISKQLDDICMHFLTGIQQENSRIFQKPKMQFNKILFMVLALVPASLANLLCYHCEDCALRTAVIQPCGFSDDVQTIPATLKTTTNFPWPTVVLTTAAGGDDENVPSKNPSERPGSATTTVSGRPGASKPNDGEPLLTPPTAPGTIYPVRSGFAGVTPSIGEDKQSYGCLTMKAVENKREVVRRGCVRVGLHREEMCHTDSSKPVQKCEICTKDLCNN